MMDISGHLRVAEWAQKNFHGRREFEWRIAIGVWSLQAGAIVLEASDKLPRIAPLITWSAAIAPVVFYAVFWVRHIWRANQQDKAISERFAFMAATAIDPEFTPALPTAQRITRRELRWWFGFLGDWSAQFQIGTTGMLAIIMALVAQSPPTTRAPPPAAAQQPATASVAPDLNLRSGIR